MNFTIFLNTEAKWDLLAHSNLYPVTICIIYIYLRMPRSRRIGRLVSKSKIYLVRLLQKNNMAMFIKINLKSLRVLATRLKKK